MKISEFLSSFSLDSLLDSFSGAFLLSLFFFCIVLFLIVLAENIND